MNKQSVYKSPLDRYLIAGGQYVSLLFLFSGIIIVFEIGARYLFNAPTIWVHETTIFLCSVCYVYGGSHCLARNKHIGIGLIYDNVPPLWRWRLDLFIAFMGAIFGLVLTWAAWTMTEQAIFAPWGDFRLETSGSAWNPPFPAFTKAFIFIVFIVMTLQFIFHLAYHLRHKPHV